MISIEKTICWDCAKARGECSWSVDLVPVEGWTALPTIRKPGTKDEMRSYLVIDCPEFKRDAWNGGATRLEEHEERHKKKDGNHHPEKQ